MSDRLLRPTGWDVDEDEGSSAAFKRLSASEAQDLRLRDPSVSPWRVLAVQVLVGLAMALIAGLVTSSKGVAWSALYGAAAVVLPGALLARGMRSKVSSMSPGVSAVSFMLWEFVKIATSIAMLTLAPKWVPQLSWPALLAGMVVCMKVYWVALLWRGR